ncbi:restriction endonuclease [Brevibacillus sp. HB1.2]|uniref:restriction endonuclease n=1 Tax=Brevibacillus sp. HB1.2 TaxID=2738807 RepID=UPI001575D1A8|nr:restriction endonuclease [Brevibacillus sp. HB1.2]NTU22462.1 restriction endonuclease [Brevibacillus sp. HB1.2]
MARTYYAEERQIVFLFRGLFVMLAVLLFFYVAPGLHWGFFFLFIGAGVLLAEIMGTIWTRYKRQVNRTNKSAVIKKIKGSSDTVTPQKQRRTRAKLTDDEIMSADIETLSGTEFERLMEFYYHDQGYSVERIGGSGDHEVDLILKGKEGYKIAVQCKRWKRSVGNDIVLRLKAGKQVHGCYDAWIITTSHFTKAAQEAAERLNIRLINGVTVHDMITRWRKQQVKLRR